MKLYVGGVSQGKLNYVLSKNNIFEQDVTYAKDSDINDLLKAECIYKLNDWINNNIDEEKVNLLVDKLITDNPKSIVICDEVGYGVVPMEKRDRMYRELVGRSLIRLAKFSDEVERVVCGIGVRIK